MQPLSPSWLGRNTRILMSKLQEFLIPLLKIKMKNKSKKMLMLMADALLTTEILKIILVSWKAYVKRK